MAHVSFYCAGLAIVLVVVQFWLYGIRFNRLYDASTVSSVTLANGQTYFGYLQKYGPKTLVLSNVYYLQVSDDATADQAADTTTAEADTAATEPESNIKLMHLTDDFHKPYDHLVLNRDQVIYWQYLQSDSPILEAIAEYNQQ